MMGRAGRGDRVQLAQRSQAAGGLCNIQLSERAGHPLPPRLSQPCSNPASSLRHGACFSHRLALALAHLKTGRQRLNGTDEVRQEDHRAFERAYDERPAVGIVCCDLPARSGRAG